MLCVGTFTNSEHLLIPYELNQDPHASPRQICAYVSCDGTWHEFDIAFFLEWIYTYIDIGLYISANTIDADNNLQPWILVELGQHFNTDIISTVLTQLKIANVHDKRSKVKSGIVWKPCTELMLYRGLLVPSSIPDQLLEMVADMFESDGVSSACIDTFLKFVCALLFDSNRTNNMASEKKIALDSSLQGPACSEYEKKLNIGYGDNPIECWGQLVESLLVPLCGNDIVMQHKQRAVSYPSPSAYCSTFPASTMSWKDGKVSANIAREVAIVAYRKVIDVQIIHIVQTTHFPTFFRNLVSAYLSPFFPNND